MILNLKSLKDALLIYVKVWDSNAILSLELPQITGMYLQAADPGCLGSNPTSWLQQLLSHLEHIT